jgi:hypothetical protein
MKVVGDADLGRAVKGQAVSDSVVSEIDRPAWLQIGGTVHYYYYYYYY